MAATLAGPVFGRLQRIGIPVGAALLTLFFVALGFPYDRVRDLASSTLSRVLGAPVRIGSLGPTLTVFGPGVRVTALEITFAGGRRVAVDDARVRPAWSLGWLRGNPAIFVDAVAAEGHAVGTVSLAGEPGFAGALSDVDLAKLALGDALAGVSLDGVASADVDLHQTAAGPRGSLDLTAVKGSIALPGLPVALPFETLSAKARATDTAVAEGLEVDLQGPMLTAQVTGSVGLAPTVTNAPLDLQVTMKVVDPSLRPMLGGTGLRFAQDGTARIRLSGTVGRPLVR